MIKNRQLRHKKYSWLPQKNFLFYYIYRVVMKANLYVGDMYHNIEFFKFYFSETRRYYYFLQILHHSIMWFSDDFVFGKIHVMLVIDLDVMSNIFWTNHMPLSLKHHLEEVFPADSGRKRRSIDDWFGNLVNPNSGDWNSGRKFFLIFWFYTV